MALKMQQPINAMINNISRDSVFLTESLSDLVSVDPFIRKLYDIYQTVQKEGVAARHMLGIFRSDYLIDDLFKLNQVEINTISVSFVGVGPKISELHCYALKNYKGMDEQLIKDSIPNNASALTIAQTLADAHATYSQNEAAILVLIEDNVVNILDQKFVEWNTKNINGNIKFFRRSFRDLNGNISLGPNKELLLSVNTHMQTNETVEIAIVYFRTAYTTINFDYENSWTVRLLIEQSKAIKCPSIHFQLAGLKKFQTLLCKRPIFDRYLMTTHLQNDIYETFTQFWDVEPNALQMVQRDPDSFVLKSNLEGGGNNFFGEEILPKMKEILDHKQSQAYFLMKYIKTSNYDNYILPTVETVGKRTKDDRSASVKSELGTYGTILVDNNGQILFNRNAGHLIRSKFSFENEAGIMAGSGFLDSPFLVDLDTNCYKITN